VPLLLVARSLVTGRLPEDSNIDTLLDDVVNSTTLSSLLHERLVLCVKRDFVSECLLFPLLNKKEEFKFQKTSIHHSSCGTTCLYHLTCCWCESNPRRSKLVLHIYNMLSSPSPSPASQRKNDDDDDDEKGFGEGFACCYLVASLSEQLKGKTYVGFTVNPKRRLLQHNGQYANAGAKYTKKLRPCEMVFCVHGFPTKTQALGFEWAWQNPTTSRAVKDLAQNKLKIGSRHSTILNKSLLGLAMLNLSPWRHLPLVIHFFDDTHKRDVIENAEKKDVNIPSHVRVEVGEMNELDAYVKECNPTKTSKKKRRKREDSDDDDDDLESEDFLPLQSQDSDIFMSSQRVSKQQHQQHQQHVCEVCLRQSNSIEGGNNTDSEYADEVCCTCSLCGAHAHLVCLAENFFKYGRDLHSDKENRDEDAIHKSYELIPEKGQCPRCDRVQSWGDVLASRSRGKRNVAPKHRAQDSADKEMNTAEKRAQKRAKINSWTEEIEIDSLSPPAFA
jgi:structure-specific endonuclease subunit SLX1